MRESKSRALPCLATPLEGLSLRDDEHALVGLQKTTSTTQSVASASVGAACALVLLATALFLPSEGVRVGGSACETDAICLLGHGVLLGEAVGCQYEIIIDTRAKE